MLYEGHQHELASGQVVFHLVRANGSADRRVVLEVGHAEGPQLAVELTADETRRLALALLEDVHRAEEVR